MQITIKAEPKSVEQGRFNYSNTDSSYGVNTQYFTKNGKPFTIISGEVHFSRLPRERWRETILKMRACGINTVATYVFWNYHEENKNNFDFDGLNLQMFSGNTLIDDYSNTDRKFVMYLRDYKKYIEKNHHLLSALYRKQNSVFQTFIMKYRFL